MATDNPYFDQLVDEERRAKGRLAANVSSASGVNADAIAAQRQLAKYIGFQPGVGEALPDEIQSRAAIRRVENDTANAPVLGRHFADNDFARVSHDDSGVLSALEKQIGKGARYVMGAAPGGGVFGDAQTLAPRYVEGMTGVARAVNDVLDWMVRPVVGADNLYSQNAKQLALDGRAARAQVDALSPPDDSIVGGGVSSGVQSLMQSAKYIPLAMTGPAGAAVALAGMGLESFGATYNRTADAGAPLATAVLHALSDATIEVATEAPALKGLVEGIKAGAPFIKTLLANAIAENKGEQIATAAQDFNEWVVLHPDKTLGDYLMARPGAAAKTFIATLVGVGGNTAFAEGVQRSIDTVVGDSRRAVHAEQQALMLAEAFKIASESKLRERDPDTFAQFVQAVAAETDGAPTSVFVDAETLVEVFNQSGVTPEQFAEMVPGADEALRTALLTGATVELPVGRLLAKVAGTGLEAALLPHLRTAEDAPSQMEAKQAMDVAQEFLQTEAAAVMAGAEDAAALQADAATVQARVLEHLTAAGRFTADVNEVNAVTARDLYVALSSRMGITPSQLYERYPLVVAGQQLVGLDAPITQEIAGVTDNASRDGAASAEALSRWRQELESGQVRVLVNKDGTARTLQGVDSVDTHARKGQVILQRGIGRNDWTVVSQGDDVKASAIARAISKAQGAVDAAIAELPIPVADTTETFDDDQELMQRGGGDTTHSVQAQALLDALPETPILSSIDLMTGDAPTFANQAELAAFFTKANRKRAAKPDHPATRKAIVDALYAEALLAITPRGNAIGWYDRKVEAALNIIAEVHPEILTDERSKFAFIALTAVTSNGMWTRDNFALSEKLYRTVWKPTGRFPEKVPEGGARHNKMAESLSLLNDMIDEYGWENVREFMTTPHTAAEVKAYARSKSTFGEGVDEVVPGSLFLGPKIGGAYFSNLYGNFTPVTMDRWFMRTINRIRGKMLTLPASFKGKQLDELSTQLLSGEINTFGVPIDKIIADIALYETFTEEQQHDAVYVRQKLKHVGAYAKARHRVYTKGDGKKGYTDRSPENRLAKNIDLSLNAGNDAPFGSKDRMWIRGLMADVSARLKENGIDVVNADLQALLWYYEKDLYAKLIPRGADDADQQTLFDVEDPDTELTEKAEDYETAARYAVRRLHESGVLTGAAGRSGPGGVGVGAAVAEGSRRAPAKQFTAEGLWHGTDLNATESRLLDAGYAGYFVRNAFNGQGAAVVIGPQSRGLEAQSIPNPTTQYAAPVPPQPFRRALMAEELDRIDLPAVQAAAPSAKVRSGTFQVDKQELRAARSVLAAQGIVLPGGENLNQGERGSFRPSTLTITFLQNANLTTFNHELSHFYLTVLSDIAGKPNAPEAVVADMNTLLDWFGVKDIETWNKMSLSAQREYHEKWAIGFEQYLFTGKAPSAPMQPLFRRFRAWYLSVYKSLSEFMRLNGDATFTPEVRAVADRMLATDAQIAQTEAEQGMLPNDDATMTAIETLQARSLRDLKWTIEAKSRELRRLQGEVEDKRKAVRAEMTAVAHQMPEYAAQRWLKHGLRPDGTKDVGGKLSTTALREMYGDGPAAPWRYLATNMVAAEDGLHPNAVAPLFGYTDGDAMVRAIVGAEQEANAIDGLTDRALLERYGDLVTEAGVERAANEAVHNEARGRFVASQMKALAEGMNPREDTGRTTRKGHKITVNALVAAARNFAQNVVASTKVINLKPAKFTAAETRASKKADVAQAAGDARAAIAAKREQMLSHYTATAMLAAQTEVAKKLEYLKRFDKDSVRKNIPPEYLDQIDQLLERFDLRKSTSQRDIDKRESLLAWVEAQAAKGLVPVVPEELLAEANKTSYKELTVEAFRGLADTVRNIDHLGKLKNKLLKSKDQREFSAIVAEITASIADNVTQSREQRTNAPTTADRALDQARAFGSMHRKASSIIRQLDGFKDNGPFWRVYVKTMNDSADTEAVMHEQASKMLMPIFEALRKTGKISERVVVPGIKESLTLETRLVVALNWGNETNRKRIMDGDNWTEQQVNAILSTLTREQLKFVESVWSAIDSYWPAIKAKEERVTGLAPEKVAASPFVVNLPGGETVEMAGGYYPIKYDPDKSSRAESDTAAEQTKQMLAGHYARATTRRGHTKSRVDTVKRSVRKDITVVFEHINQVVHDLSWHEWLVDATKLLRSQAIDDAIRSTIGPEMLRELKKSTEDIAAGDVPAEAGFERAVNHIRNGVTVVGLGWNLTTALLQPLGLAQSMARIGPKWVGKGLSKWVGDAAKFEDTTKWVYSVSPFMRLRGDTMSRELNDIRNTIHDKKFTAIEASFFYMIQKMQLVADMPTWLGQYEKSMAETGADEEASIALADQAVRDSQGAGQLSDQARIQRGDPLRKLFTNFYSYFSATYNLMVESGHKAKLKDPLSVGRFAVDTLLLTVVPAALATLLREALMGGDDDDELLERLVRDQLNYLLGTMVLLREAGAVVQGYHAYQGPAGTRFFGEIAKLAKQAEQGEVDAALLKALNNATGILFHYPAGQINRTVEGFLALKEGETENPLALVLGPPKQ